MSDNQQVPFWRGVFGDGYISRNVASAEAIANRRTMWQRILKPLDRPPASILEVGANIGLNLRALADLVPAELYAVEPNAKARTLLGETGALPTNHIYDGVAADLPLADGIVDFVFTSGVLIHVAPEDLLASCREIHRVSSGYIACVEYFSPVPVDVEYRGHSGYLFKRDFGAFWLDNFADLTLVDYGFFWKRATGLDDLTWWLFRKQT